MNDLALLIEAEVCLEKMIERAESIQDEGAAPYGYQSNELMDEIRTSIDVLNRLKLRIKGVV